jgi:hypothetical protein
MLPGMVIESHNIANVNTLQGLKPRSFCRTLALTATTLCDTDVTRPILPESSEPILLLYDTAILPPNT